MVEAVDLMRRRLSILPGIALRSHMSLALTNRALSIRTFASKMARLFAIEADRSVDGHLKEQFGINTSIVGTGRRVVVVVVVVVGVGEIAVSSQSVDRRG